MNYYSVAVNAPLWPDLLTYSSEQTFYPGMIVKIPLGKRSSEGVVIEKITQPENSRFEVKKIIESDNRWLDLNENELQLLKWVSKYYQYPLGQTIFDSLPSPTKKVNGLKKINAQNQEWKFLNSEPMNNILKNLINIESKGFSQHLLHGVTGSGKSFIYLQWIKDLIAKKKSVLYLVPEINLTPQFVAFFSAFLDCEIYQFHSQISPGQRFALYHYLKSDHQPLLIISARSGIFLPLDNLGAIIIDEEHDQSYKQEDRCRYHARDVATYRAKQQNIPILLGSATPSLETYFRFKQNTPGNNDHTYYYELKDRYHNQAMPNILKLQEPHYSEKNWPINEEAIKTIKEVIKNQGQVLVFMNKLGFARYIMCKNCHHDVSCPNCTVKLTLFKNRQTLECHQCEYQMPVPKSCSKCGCLDLWSQGYGVEKVVEKLSEHFSPNTILRIDRDATKTVRKATEAFESFEKGEYKILVGTQMITKGHNFQNVKLVLVLGIDAQLHSAEFRAKEKVFQLLNQVAGRAGRLGDHSQILVQSNVSTEELNLLLSQKDHRFYEEELKIRKFVMYPPWRKMAQIVLRSKNKNIATQTINVLKERIKKTISSNNLPIEVKGPQKTSLEKIKNYYGETLTLISDRPEKMQIVLRTLQNEVESYKKSRLIINVDPQQLE